MKKKVLSIILIFTLILLFVSCGKKDDRLNDIVILFTNDVHCGIDDNIGYAGVKAYKNEMEAQYKNVTLIDCGDFSQGDFVGAVSNGEYMVDLMNAVGYDYAILGNHEFDYGMTQLQSNLKKLNAKVLNCNMFYKGKGEDWVKENTIPYVIESYGDIDVAYIGISTPWSITSSTPLRFMSEGGYIYDFSGNEGAQHFYDVIQENIDECKEKGAEYVVLLSHLGVDIKSDTPFTSIELVNNTTGVDVVLDAHSHVVTADTIEKNKEGKDVNIASTGTKIENIGKLVISEDGTIEVSLISDYEEKDEEVLEKIDEINKQFETILKNVVGHSDYNLSCYDDEGVRMIRCREMAIGDFVADAYRIIGEANIGMCNGGGIRDNIDIGDITYEEIIAVNPYGNTLCVVEVTGAEVLDMLEYFYRTMESEYKKDGKVIVEEGSFQQVSGIKFTVDTSIESSVVVSEEGALLSVGKSRRVKDVMILQGEEYVPIDLNQTYRLASHNYMIKNGGSGMLYFLKDHKLVIDEGLSDYQILINYLDVLGGDLNKYSKVDNRITIK